MSRFPLRCTITAVCFVALSSSIALGQSDSTAHPSLVERASPTLMAPTPVGPMATAVPAVDALTPRDIGIVTQQALMPVNTDAASIVRRREAFSRPQVLMITGGALLLTGLIVDGDASTALIIAGAGIGGYGLYLHLQSPNARFRR